MERGAKCPLRRDFAFAVFFFDSDDPSSSYLVTGGSMEGVTQVGSVQSEGICHLVVPILSGGGGW